EIEAFSSKDDPHLATLIAALPAVVGRPYVAAIQALPDAAVVAGTAWLDGIVARVVDTQLARLA
ncbi:MAG: hypothetical protein KAI47_08640, partial [Deltaproteobacteria bacterium]|nr:hypothetical protein [Deltaproteobacteria bacterium]